MVLYIIAHIVSYCASCSLTIDCGAYRGSVRACVCVGNPTLSGLSSGDIVGRFGVLIQHTPCERIVSAAPVQTKVSLAQWYASNREKYKCQLLLKIERPERAFCLISPGMNRAWSTLKNTVFFCPPPKDGPLKILALRSPTWKRLEVLVESSGIISGAVQHMQNPQEQWEIGEWSPHLFFTLVKCVARLLWWSDVASKSAHRRTPPPTRPPCHWLVLLRWAVQLILCICLCRSHYLSHVCLVRRPFRPNRLRFWLRHSYIAFSLAAGSI